VTQTHQITQDPAPTCCDSPYADEAIRRQPWCSICASTNDLEAHHVIWLEHGGTDALHNLDVLCATHHALVHNNPAWDRRVRERYFGVRAPRTASACWPLCAGLLDGAL